MYLFAVILKRLKAASSSFRLLAFGDNVLEIVGQDEGHSLSADTVFLLKVAQDVAEIDMEQLASFLYHDVVWMTISDAENICRHAVSGTG